MFTVIQKKLNVGGIVYLSSGGIYSKFKRVHKDKYTWITRYCFLLPGVIPVNVWLPTNGRLHRSYAFMGDRIQLLNGIERGDYMKIIDTALPQYLINFQGNDDLQDIKFDLADNSIAKSLVVLCVNAQSFQRWRKIVSAPVIGGINRKLRIK